MKLVRIERNGTVCYGELEGDRVCLFSGDLLSGLQRTGNTAGLEEVRLLAPAVPSKAVCVGLNYLDHIRESGAQVPEEPVVFMKPSTAVIGPGEGILYPSLSHRVDYEGELAVVIGKKASHVPQERAAEYILGYTCANDVTARDLQPPDGQWTVAKGFDTFLPLGPCICTDIDPLGLRIRTELDGRIVQDSNTGFLLFKPHMLVSYLSSVMTLYPGDVILTGTSSGIGPMEPGSRVCVEIEGIGRLENFVQSARG